MKWVIKNPAPSDSRRTKWGDYHFGRSLTTQLERRGHVVVTHYDPGWDQDEPADVVLVLRGRYPFPLNELHRGATRVGWNISHPDDLGIDECAQYDLVCVASLRLRDALAAQLDVPVHALFQCTDTEEFHPGRVDAIERAGIVFVGNTRDVDRPVVRWALDYGLPLRIWGRGWQAFGVAEDRVVADYIANERLGRLYAGSRATLNDHWDDMRRWGFVNNRVFDALACGLPVVSDWHDALASLRLPGVLLYRDRHEFEDCMEQVLLDGPRLERWAATAIDRVRDEFSFASRAEQLEQLVLQVRGATS